MHFDFRLLARGMLPFFLAAVGSVLLAILAMWCLFVVANCARLLWGRMSRSARPAEEYVGLEGFRWREDEGEDGT